MSNAQDSYTFEGFSAPNYTQVPDEFFDKVMPHLAEGELRANLYIIRRTFGFKKTSDSISLNQFLHGITTADGKQLDTGCGICSRTHLMEALKGLEAKGIIEAIRTRSEKGNACTTVYRLRFRTSVEATEGVVPERHHPSTRRAPPVVPEGHLQETGLQETDEQETASTLQPLSESRDSSPSNIRKGARQKSSEGTTTDNTEPTPDKQETQTAPEAPTVRTAVPDTVPAPHGFSSAATLLADRFRIPTNAAGQASKPAARAQAAPAPGAAHSATEDDRVVIGAYLKDYTWKLHDQAKLKSTISRAYNLYLAAQPYDRQRFIETLHLAYRKTQEQTTIRGSKMAYFFGVLERELGLKPLPEMPSRAPQDSRPQLDSGHSPSTAYFTSAYASRRKNYVPVISRAPQGTENAPGFDSERNSSSRIRMGWSRPPIAQNRDSGAIPAVLDGGG